MSKSIAKRVTTGVVAASGALVVGIVGMTTASASTADSPGATEGAEVPPCASGQLKVIAGEPQPTEGVQGQFDRTLILKNISETTCGVEGLPTVDLTGPEHAPYGDTFRLPQEPGHDKDFVALTPGEGSEVATLRTLTPSLPEDDWTPETISVTPPGLDTPVTFAWPEDLPVLRQDGATHPGSYVLGLP
ncbi:DUF4232 domain-containing protein [Prauserella cavernicola]|uniref:DUF4232 domain-containing protein n=1 Tax=Prauserella cavernicola TaxID=2800127 RepID=A0A934QW69_9PSEU|nr:DUF4232 domain-containing protein [Prauserella cavernicola]MBK1787533.1 DUF4232 domain-containing protein [Prauserella cavernicola]